MSEALKELNHCVIAVRDWLAGGCDANDIPRPHIAALVAFSHEAQQAQAPGWQHVPVELLSNAKDDAQELLALHLQAYGEEHKPQRAAYYREQIAIFDSLLSPAPQQGAKP